VTRVAIVGASGYTGGELLRLLATHRGVQVTVATSREHVGRPVHYVHFNLRGVYRDLRFSKLDTDLISERADAVFLSLPHGVSMKYVPAFLEVGMKVIDLSADFRLKNPQAYRYWYGFEHPYPDLLRKAVYGMPELRRSELRDAQLIAVPGCNATASILALLPLARGGVGDLSFVVIDVKAGSSEAGSKPSLPDHHPEREGSVRPYSAEGHRHVAEVEQELGAVTGSEISVSLTPHAVPCVRGVLATAYVRASGEVGAKDLMKAYALTYGREPFVRLVRNSPHKYPNPKYVIGSNFADVSFAVEERLGVIKSFSAIDNLVKGAAGQAVQAFNISAGFPEGEGLKFPPLKPV